jgi:hypothetical protein
MRHPFEGMGTSPLLLEEKAHSYELVQHPSHPARSAHKRLDEAVFVVCGMPYETHLTMGFFTMCFIINQREFFIL